MRVERSGTPEPPALSQGGPERKRPLHVDIGLQALGQHARARRAGVLPGGLAQPSGPVVDRLAARSMSSLTTSGRTKGSRASERQSAPRSSRAIPQSRPRSSSVARSISAGRSTRPRSVSSCTTLSSSLARCRSGACAGGQRLANTSGSALMNRAAGGRSPPSIAPAKAAARQAQSSSSRRPSPRPAAKRAAGLSRADPRGPRASAS